jgi:hypothetical protein
VPTILPHDGSKHVDGNRAGPLEFWLSIMVAFPVQLEYDEQMVSNHKIVSQEKI